LVTDVSGQLIPQAVGRKFYFDCVNLADGTGVLPQSIGKQLPT